MTPSEQVRQYRRVCQQQIIVRRYTGTGTPRPKTDYPAMGNAKLYGAQELEGTIEQGDQKVIVIAGDLQALGFPFPMSTTDRVVVGGVERRVVVVGERKALDGTLIAYEVQARG